MAIRIRRGKWHYRFMLQGRAYSGSTDLDGTERNRTAAQRVEAQKYRLVSEGKGEMLRLEVRLFGEAAETFLAWSKAEHRAHPNTSRRHEISFSSLRAFFGKLPVHAITVGKIEDYKTWRRLEHEVREVTIRHDLHALSCFFQYCRKHNWCTTNPCREVDIPSDAESQRMHVLSDAEEQKYFSAAARFSNLHDVARLMLLQGMRPDEVMRISSGDVDMATGRLSIQSGKTKSARRIISLTGEARIILQQRMVDAGTSGWLFKGKAKGERLTKLNSTHSKVLAATGLRFVLYDLRHTFATRMAQNGTDAFTLAAILGHSSVRCVSRYVHPTQEHQAEAMRRYEKTLKPALRLVR